MYLGDGSGYDPPIPPFPADSELGALQNRVMVLEDTLTDAREGLDYARQLKTARLELYLAVIALALLAGFIGGAGVVFLLRS